MPVALNYFEEQSRTVLDGLGEDLEKIAIVIVINQYVEGL